MSEIETRTRLPCAALRWSCDADCYSFQSTAEVAPIEGVVAQPTAREALEYGLISTAHGQNVYVRGQPGTGRLTMVRQTLKSISGRAVEKLDRCYVHNFSRPDQPRLISLPAGCGRIFRRRMLDLADFVEKDLPKALETEALSSERLVIEKHAEERLEKITQPLEQDLGRADMRLVSMQRGPIVQTMIFPVVDGEPVPPAKLKQLVREKKVSEKRLKHFEEHYPEFQKRLQAVGGEIATIQRESVEEIQALNEKAIRDALADLVASIKARFPSKAMITFLGEVVDDVITTRFMSSEEPANPHDRYGVNVILARQPDETAPVVEEHAPTLTNLLGTVEFKWEKQGPAPADYSCIRAGALLRADRGYLVLDVDDVLSEPGAWRALMRTLRTGQLEIVPPEISWLRPQVLIKPEPIPISVRVILVGDALSYYQLDQLDTDFRELFKVLADFDLEINRDEQGIQHYAAVIAQMAKDDDLLPMDPTGVAALTEHGARIAAHANKLTARFGRIRDIACEASFLASQDDDDLICRDHVYRAVRRTKERASLPSRRFQELIRTGMIQLRTEGAVVGQVNGLAVMQAGPITYGFPARITATIGAGRAGLINIEGRAAMSGSIHTKGFHILGGLLRYLLKADHPLAFSASIAFEQSYGGIDGDSASGAEICCLLSALTDIPIRQNLAMTGAIDQHGHVQAIGGANEKIEGFFDACNFFGLKGDQGVIIPRSNAGDLMLRPDIVEACELGQFHIYTVDNVHEALELFTGVPAGEYTKEGYTEGTLLKRAVDQAGDYWRKTLQGPASLTQQVIVDEEEPSRDQTL